MHFVVVVFLVYQFYYALFYWVVCELICYFFGMKMVLQWCPTVRWEHKLEFKSIILMRLPLIWCAHCPRNKITFTAAKWLDISVKKHLYCQVFIKLRQILRFVVFVKQILMYSTVNKIYIFIYIWGFKGSYRLHCIFGQVKM